MRRATVGVVLVVLAVGVFALPASASKPPPADGSAQGACEQARLMQVNAQTGLLDPDQSDYSMLIELLRESKSKGALKLGNRLLDAPTGAAQEVVTEDVRSWCSDVLQVRCSAFVCVGGRRVERIGKRS